MLAILASHRTEYQAAIWRALAASGKVPFEVWYLSNHGASRSLAEGYPYRYLDVAPESNLREFHGVRLRENLAKGFARQGVRALWVEGWRFSALWKAVKVARRCGVEVWMRSASNDLRRDRPWKWLAKQGLLARHLTRVDRFLCVGGANRRLYASFGIGKSRMVSTPYCVDNDRFARQAAELRSTRDGPRAKWKIPPDAFCFLFCGRFSRKNHPSDLVAAAQAIERDRGPAGRPPHLLFAGTGALGGRLRGGCRVAFDAEVPPTRPFWKGPPARGGAGAPAASFVGRLNQSEMAAAYVAADALVLPSDSGEAWGKAVNEALACGIPAVASDQCGCAEDLAARVDKRLVFRCGDIGDLARAMRVAMDDSIEACRIQEAADSHHPRHTVAAIEDLYRRVSG